MKKVFIILIIILSFLFGNQSSRNLQIFLENKFAKKYDIDQSDVSLNIYHVPKINFNDVEFRISGKSNLKLGYNRTNIQMLKNGRIENEFQITYSARIEFLTPVLKHDVKYGQPVKTNDLVMQRKSIDGHYKDYFRDNNIDEGMIAKALLREGEILKRSDLKQKPVVKRGQEVELKLITGNILIELNGIAKESGSNGERIRVYNRQTRRHYFGVIESPQNVVINIE